MSSKWKLTEQPIVLGAVQEKRKAHTEQSKQRSSDIKQLRDLEGHNARSKKKESMINRVNIVTVTATNPEINADHRWMLGEKLGD